VVIVTVTGEAHEDAPSTGMPELLDEADSGAPEAGGASSPEPPAPPAGVEDGPPSGAVRYIVDWMEIVIVVLIDPVPVPVGPPTVLLPKGNGAFDGVPLGKGAASEPGEEALPELVSESYPLGLRWE